MLVTEIDSKESDNKYFSWSDNRMKSATNKSLYSDDELVRHERVRLALTYLYEKVFPVTWRKKSAAIKVSGRIKNSKMLKEMESEWATRGYVKRVSKNNDGVIYHIPRLVS